MIFKGTGGFLLLTVVFMEVSSQYTIDLTDVRLYTEAGILFGGAVEVSTSNGWERVCFTNFTSDLADFVCQKRAWKVSGDTHGKVVGLRTQDFRQRVPRPATEECSISTIQNVGILKSRRASSTAGILPRPDAGQSTRCPKRYEEGAMLVRPLASLGVIVNPTPSLTCRFNTAEGNRGVKCQYSSTCRDHAALICNYPGYLGCYRHTRNSPSVDDALIFTSPNLTVQACLSHCRQSGHAHAGVAFGQDCYCQDQELDGSLRLGNEDCYLPCVGDSLQICGGGTAVGIYDSRLGSCNGIYNDVEGAIASPGFPGRYSNNRNCKWTIDVPNAANVTVHFRAVGLYRGDQVKVSNPAMADYVAFTGGQSISDLQFHSSGRTLDASLLFTFPGNRIVVEFVSTPDSPGAQGVVLTFSSALGPRPELPVTPNTTQVPTEATGINGVSLPSSTSRPTTTPLTDGYVRTTQSVTTATIGVSSVATDAEGAPPSTPRSITIVHEAPQTAPSIAVIVAIAVGIVLILLLVVTAVVLFTTSYTHKPSPRRKKHEGAVTNAGYAISSHSDAQRDSGIYDPGYETADVEDPIYLSIRNDPRARHLMRRDSSGSYASLKRNQSVSTDATDHDYQSVRGVSRANTERSYLSLYGDNSPSVFSDNRHDAPSSGETCKVAEDGYMIPTPKSSTQIKMTKL